MVRSLSVRSGLLLWYNQPAGACEVLDTNRLPAEQRCTRPAACAVWFRNGPTEVPAYSCLAHAAPLASLAERSPHVTATVYPLGR
ncbi:hypothetical protein AB0L75_42470 [Streptomyces sp. NPDC052101]|uniref:hypothetical protein n=1 Tax=Streptomyces sp. NPDC052101 TaxID=3155763 RepID=UPI00341396C0